MLPRGGCTACLAWSGPSPGTRDPEYSHHRELRPSGHREPDSRCGDLNGRAVKPPPQSLHLPPLTLAWMPGEGLSVGSVASRRGVVAQQVETWWE